MTISRNSVAQIKNSHSFRFETACEDCVGSGNDSATGATVSLALFCVAGVDSSGSGSIVTESVTPTLGRVHTAELGRPIFSNEPRN